MHRSIIPTLAVAAFGMAVRVRLVRHHTNFAKMYQKLIRTLVWTEEGPKEVEFTDYH